MRSLHRHRFTALFFAAILFSLSSSGRSDSKASLQDALRQPYLDLFKLTEKTQYSAAEIGSVREALKDAQKICVSRFKKQAEQYAKEIEQLQKELKDDKTITAAKRQEIHCKIQDLRALQAQAEMLAEHAIPLAYANRKAKLDLIEQWPAKFKEISKQLEKGTYRNRRWGDVEDIGFREIEAGQEKDIKTGEDAIRDLKARMLMPKEIDNSAVKTYITRIAQRVATHSDLRVPLKVTVLDSKEINAFALPGGFLFIERGLLEAVDDEAELAGVLGHEMSHVVARHGQQLMRRAGLMDILLQAAQIAAVLTGGGVGAFGAYALQYGFYGLGFVLDLNLLGVSRDFELQADQLGIQYAWNSGYDPTGFVRFFDKMATTKGYVEGASWFYDHPPFYERMVEAEEEISFLPGDKSLVVQTSEFGEMKNALAKVTFEARKAEEKKPSLFGAAEKACAAARKPEYEPGQDIATICSPTKE
jgi:Zn-dependent protease with chaperone function